MFQVEWAELVANNIVSGVTGVVTGTVADSIATENLAVSTFSTILNTQTQRFQSGNQHSILYEVDQQAEPNPWLNRVGYDKHLGPFDMSEMRSLAINVPDSDEQMNRVSTHIIKTLWNVVKYARSIDKNNPSLFHVNQIGDAFPNWPFNPVYHSFVWGVKMTHKYHNQGLGKMTRGLIRKIVKMTRLKQNDTIYTPYCSLHIQA
jgi:hypothetical protein